MIKKGSHSYIPLSNDDVVYLHGKIISDKEPQGFHLGSDLSSALCRIENKLSYEPDSVRDIFDIAALYASVICKAHAFQNGNKRTATQCAITFLKINSKYNVSPELSIQEQLAQQTVALTTEEITYQQYADFLKKISVVIENRKHKKTKKPKQKNGF